LPFGLSSIMLSAVLVTEPAPLVNHPVAFPVIWHWDRRMVEVLCAQTPTLLLLMLERRTAA
jgi:hypothetical protein